MLPALISVCVLSSQCGSAQDAASSETPQQAEVVLVKLSPPFYAPPGASSTNRGDVEVYVHVRKDGSVASVELLS